MNKLIALAFVMLIQLSNAQTLTYWVRLKDKNSTTFSLKHPEAFLSAKALERRQRQHIEIVQNDLPVSLFYIQEIRKTGVQLTHWSKWFNTVSIATDDLTKVEAIKALPFVQSVQLVDHPVSVNRVSKFESLQFSNTNAYEEKERSTPTAYNYGPSFKQADQIGIVCMHENGFNGDGVTIAVLDAGFLNANTISAFDSLRLENRLLGTRDFATGDTMVFEDDSHGTMVLSCMTGNLPGQLIGTAPKAKYWLLRTEVVATESIQEEMNWAVGAEFADSVGADIISTSLGYSTFDDSLTNHTYKDMDGNTTIISKAADIAASKGIFVTVSAGNEGSNEWFRITAPSDADSVLCVGAIDSLGGLAYFSSRGPSYDGRVKPNTVARGYKAYLATPSGTLGFANGTSFSCPITAGAVACLWQSGINKTNMQLLHAIEESASQYANPDSLKGYGIPDFCKAKDILTGLANYSVLQNTLNVYPNPFQSSFTVLYTPAKQELITLELRDLTGRVLKTQALKVNAGQPTKLNFNADQELAAGIYLISVGNAEHIISKKVIKE